MDYKLISRRVKEIRTDILKLSQREFARALDMQSRSAISMWENEESEKCPSKPMVLKISNLANVSVDYILGLSNYKNLDESQSSEVKTELHNMISKIEKLDADKQKLILNMIKGAVNSLDD
ncbi:helix-turn-helix domain-containing protein [Bacillus sp. NA_146.1]|uniref:helix-turn-helix domain-containing protein n=1 Tax=Bacillus wiedmannii TaxID=1890302 RepID=UPI000BF01B42|nr:helix-turn-helix transcriptional regulator [Bacillus wiedmannii]PEL97659.1 transcriptional regulator [Bacillus wiedmannii]